MKAFQPLAVIGGVSTRAGIRFNHPKQEIVISSFQDIVWAILALCDGQSDSRKIAVQVAKKFDHTEEFISQVIEDLVALEILVDSRRVYRFVHGLGNNLPSFASGLSATEVYELQVSDHMPRHQGTRFSLGKGDSTISRLGLSRRSVRGFSRTPLSMQQFEELLRVTYSRELAAAPSAGGLYPIRLYAALIQSVGELSAGLYEYDSDTHEIVLFDDSIDRPALEFALNSDSLLYGAPLILTIAAEIDRQPAKYANRGYRYSLIEAGHVAQNAHLVAQEMGLSTLEYCGFQDEQLAKVLKIEDTGIVPFLTIAVGYTGSEVSTIEAFADELSTDLVGKGKPVNWVKLINSPDTEEDYSFFHFISHYRSGNHDNAQASYADRLCGGTSTSFAMANVKAVAEAYERNRSGTIRVDVVSAATELHGQRWLDPRTFAPYSREQIEYFSTLRAFSEDAQWEWARGYDYMTKESVLVPIDLVYYPLSSAKLGRELCHYANSSGVAAHQDIQRATAGGLLELIERDAIMRNWANKSVPLRVRPADLPLHWRRRVDHWQSRGFEVDFVDFSRDGVAIIAVVIHSDEHYPHFVTGTSASIESLEAAYSKAFQEAELTLIHLRSKGERQLMASELVQPMDHGYFYAQRSMRDAVSYLWSGPFSTPDEPAATFDTLVKSYSPVVVDLSGDYPYLKVVRVFSKELIPVNFGYGADHLTHHGFPKDFRKKRFSEVEPHYLA